MKPFPFLWRSARQETSPDPHGAAGELLAALAAVLEVGQVDLAQPGRVALFLLDLSRLGFSHMDLNALMVSHAPADEEEARAQANLLIEYTQVVRAIGLCFHIVLDDQLPPPNPFMPSSLDLVRMCGQDLQRLFAAPVPSNALFEIIRRQVQLHRLCPFNTTHEARGSMFRGRKNELSQLASDLRTNYVVSGARRIGKTSLLKRAFEVLRITQAYKERVFYFDCRTWGNFMDCFTRLAHEIAPRWELRLDRGPRNVCYMLERQSAAGARPLLLFLDELDRVVETDSVVGWPFFGVLAEATSQPRPWVRLVFAGYRSMARLTLGEGDRAQPGKTLGDTPFKDALGTIKMEPLSRQETNSLVAEPFRSVQIPIRNEAQVLEHVWQTTAGYPFLVQFLCEKLFRRCSDRSPQEVTLEELREVEDGYDLRDFLFTHFRESTIEDGRPERVERLFAFLYAHQGKEGWSEQQFIQACQQVGEKVDIDKAHPALRNLLNAKILTYARGRYSITFPLLGEVLRENYPDVSFLVKLLQET